jgi:rifampicin phosphotransferase
LIKMLRQLRKEDSLCYGGKSANLGELMNNGIKVSEGFAISYDFFEDYLKNNGITYSYQQYLEKSLEIREQILSGCTSIAMKGGLFVAFNYLKNKCKASTFSVRSSSVLEDDFEHSMAGMFSSYLDLRTYDEVETALKKCYASLFSDKALHYLYENNISFSKLKMGVLVQEYIVGQPSGVIFTADTVAMDVNRILISAVNSVCQDYVRGKLPSKIYNLDKAEGSIIDIQGQETSTTLSKDLIKKLHNLALTIEKAFGTYQDIEWTFSGGEVFILQARPITTFRNTNFPIVWEKPGDENYTWFCLMPKPHPPLMQDIVTVEIAELSKGAYETLFRTDTYGESTIQNGYLYVRNIELENFDEKRQYYLESLEKLTTQGKCAFHDEILPVIFKLIEKLKPYLGERLSDEEAAKYLRTAVEYLKFTWRQHWPAVQANEFLYNFQNEFLSMFPDMELQDFYDLVKGFSLLSRERELLFSMSAIVKKSARLRQLFEDFKYDEILYARLKNDPEAKSLMKLMDAYASEFGLCDSGLDVVLHPVVMERPDYAVGQIRKLLEADENIFFDGIKKAPINKQKIKQHILKRLGPIDKELFLDKLSLAEKAFLTNDNHNYYMERMYRGYVRMASMEAGRILCEKGILEDAEDIQLLYLSEIINILEGGIFEKSIIDKRKLEYAALKKLLPPEIIGKSFDGSAFSTRSNTVTKDMPEVIKGISGLKKRVTGKVHVGMPQFLEEEAILVLPHCHCGDIMPLLNKVKGIIYNWGSPYDHLGIIAREMNIPAIYKTNTATEILRTGDEVELNGYEGVVKLLKNKK